MSVTAIKPRVPVASSITVHFTQRENEIMALLGEGLADKEIAARLDISIRTVKYHVMALRMKVGLVGHSRTELVAWLFRKGLVK